MLLIYNMSGILRKKAGRMKKCLQKESVSKELQRKIFHLVS